MWSSKYCTVLQSKEVERLNGVYNKLLRGAGVDLIGVCALLSSFSTCQATAVQRTPNFADTCSGITTMLMPDKMRGMNAEGRGKIVDAHTVEVELSSGEKRTLKTKYILLAVGGKPVKAPIPGAVSNYSFFALWSYLPPLFRVTRQLQLQMRSTRLQLDNVCRSTRSHRMMPWSWMRYPGPQLSLLEQATFQ